MTYTFTEVKSILEGLETKHFATLKIPPGSEVALRGDAQFFAMDKRFQGKVGRFPVVVCIGVNYTQASKRLPTLGEKRLVPHLGGVLDSNSASAYYGLNDLFAAYRRNRGQWESVPGPGAPAELGGVYASRDALAALASDEDFILVWSNISPYITLDYWQSQMKKTKNACQVLLAAAGTGHLDDLTKHLDAALYIGHSARPGRAHVWPAFAKHVVCHGIPRWLLTDNVSHFTRRNLKVVREKMTRQKESHEMYPWYR